MCELRETTSRELAVYLLGKNILIKDLTEKIGNGRQYIRLAVRCERDNHVLVANVKEFEKQIYQKIRDRRKIWKKIDGNLCGRKKD